MNLIGLIGYFPISFFYILAIPNTIFLTRYGTQHHFCTNRCLTLAEAPLTLAVRGPQHSQRGAPTSAAKPMVPPNPSPLRQRSSQVGGKEWDQGSGGNTRGQRAAGGKGNWGPAKPPTPIEAGTGGVAGGHANQGRGCSHAPPPPADRGPS